MVERNRPRVGGRNFKEDRAPRSLFEDSEKLPPNAGAAVRGVHRQIQQLSFIGHCLTPAAEPRGSPIDQREEYQEAGIVAQWPLGRLGGLLLEADDGGIIALGGGPDGQILCQD